MAVTVSYGRTTTVDEFAANTFQVGAGTQIQTFSDVLALSNGNFVVAYTHDNAPLNSGLDDWVLLNFYDSDGNAISSLITPYGDLSVEGVGPPSLTALANGNVVVSWQDADAGDSGVRAAIYTQDGVEVAAELDLLTNSGGPFFGSFAEPQITALNNGNFVVAYTFSSLLSDPDAYFRVYNSSGVEVVGVQGINTTTTGAQSDVQVAALTDGGFVATWSDPNSAFLTTNQILGRVFNADGTARTAEFGIGSFGANTQSSVVGLNNGNFAVVYADTGWFENGITLDIFDDTGARVNQVRADVAGMVSSEPDVTVLENGYIVVTWTQTVGASNENVTGAVFDQTGARVQLGGADTFIVDNDAADEIRSAVAGLLGGEFVTTYQDDGTTDVMAEVNQITRTVTGDGADDTYIGDALRDIMSGNGGADDLRGRNGDDTLNGGDGADFLLGGNGVDIINGDAADDVLNGGGGNDIVNGGSEADLVIGNIGQDTLNGGTGNDTLRGGAAGDALDGGDGVDTATYTTSTVRVIIDLLAGTGAGGEGAGDTLANIENILGTDFNDIMTGSAGDNEFNGGVGNDTLNGGQGSDTLLGAAGNDELNGGGNADTLNGGGNDDVLNGGAGSDTLIGNLGVDLFVFDAALGAANVDTITDYSVANDSIQLENGVFTGLAAGVLQASAFRVGAAAADADDRIVYNSLTGALSFDADGNGAGAAVQFATLSTGLAMTSNEFIVI